MFFYKLAHSLLELTVTIWNLFDQILTDGFLDNNIIVLWLLNVSQNSSVQLPF